MLVNGSLRAQLRSAERLMLGWWTYGIGGYARLAKG